MRAAACASLTRAARPKGAQAESLRAACSRTVSVGWVNAAGRSRAGFEPFGGDRTNPSQEIVRALDGRVIAIATEGDEDMRSKCDEVIFVPDLGPYLTSVLVTVPLQLFAYHVATLKGTDVDQPRNLAKSVTVE